MADYIPTADADLITFASAFKTKFAVDSGGYGFDEDEDTLLTTRFTAFQTALAAHTAAQTAARQQREQKDMMRENLVKQLRQITRRIQAHPAVSDAVRAAYGITISDSVPSYVPVPTTKPVLVVDTSQRLKHIINFSDEATPTVRAKPYGAFGAEIYRFIGEAAPVTEAGWVYLATDTATPYESTFDLSDAGKKVFYQARWVNRSGDKGTWSAVVQSTIVG